MRWKTIVNTGAETGFVTIRNDSGSALSLGQVVVWDMAGTADGLRVINPAATAGGLVVGLAASATADGDKGLAQVYGLAESAIVRRHGATASNDTIDVGDLLDIDSAVSGLRASKAAQAVLGTTGSGIALPPMFVAAESMASYSVSTVTTNMKVFVRSL